MTAQNLHSASWYRVRNLRPRLRPNVQIHRQEFRGRVWHVLQDHATGQFFRFSPETWCVIGLMDGRRTVDEIWLAASDRLGDDMPTQDEVIQLLGQLHKADALAGDVPPALRELDERARSARRGRLLKQVRNPLFVRIPLFDPDRLIAATLPLVRPLFSGFGLIVWFVVIALSAFQAGMNWEELSSNTLERVLAAESVVMMFLVFPPLKLLHELGHGWAVKRWGGEVHEIGIMLLVMLPVPYVEASSSTAFASRWRRFAVAGAGMMTELLIAAAALQIWLAAEPGLLRAAAFNVMLIAGVSTLLFNGNPLLRFDAYYMLGDLLEIPNLATRASKWWAYVCERWLFGVRDAQSPADQPGEAKWLAIYAPASFAYRIVLMLTIALFVAEAVPLVGIALAVWTVLLTLGAPAWKIARHLLTSARLERVRGRALAVTAAGCAGFVALLFAVPVPHATVAQGVVWAPEAGRVTATGDGFVRRVVVEQGAEVGPGQPLLRLEDPLLRREARVKAAKLDVLELERISREAESLTESRLVARKAAFAREDLAHVERKLAELTVTSPRAGRVRLLNPGDLPNRFVRRGELLGYVLRHGERRVRVVVLQDAVDLVRNDTRRIDLRLARDPGAEVRDVRVVREVPSGDRELPNPALALSAGGPLPLDPNDPNRRRALETFYQIELALPPDLGPLGVGERVHARFDHGREPLAAQLWRYARQTFLERLDI
ncbi:site-2 protease family protein [Ferruginivarius sediminum]|uniref:Peptidase M50 n=1 Tax=Ferruginivarius sediminum TaxID=2661937 RepID=A0A369TAY0_9PROT|nr:site-2 protease family protein [Ferruginivarius sediminum]RDD62473.1 peptidase M50 [Ferruginivarius sediminum]